MTATAALGQGHGGRRAFGAAVRSDLILADKQFARMIGAECRSLTPELELKWEWLQPNSTTWSFDSMDAIAHFARINGQALRGHTLLWHSSIPPWAAEALAARPDWLSIRNHFAAVIGRYGKAITEWDVVNEPLQMKERNDGLRPGVLLKAFGPSYVQRALEEAHGLAPQARLLINEYGLEAGTQDGKDRRYHFLKLLEGLLRNKAPLTGIGIQAHLDLGEPRVAERELADFLGHVSDMALSITISELDVKEAAYAAPVTVRDAAVADAVKGFLAVALDNRSVSGITCWGLSDRYSWLQVSAQDFGRFPNAWKPGDGPGLNRGLPLDSDLRKKPLYEVIRKAAKTR